VAAGSYQPIGPVSEVVGIATLPAYRRRGIGGALTSFLAADALSRGARTVFLSAGDSEIARVYERVGFRRIGSACVAEPA
jgi:predicted GNAT family acetyltransferase